MRVNHDFDVGFRVDHDDYSAEELARDAFYQEFLRPIGLFWHANARLEYEPGEELAISFKRDFRREAYTRDDAVALCTAGFALCDFATDVEDGDALIERALQLNPNLAWAWLFSGWGKVALGKPEVAIERLAHAMRLSPQDPQVASMQTAMASAHFVAGRYAEALSWAETAIRERPNFFMSTCIAPASAALAGRLDEARRAIGRLRELDPGLRISNLGELQFLRRVGDLDRLIDGLRRAGLPE